MNKKSFILIACFLTSLSYGESCEEMTEGSTMQQACSQSKSAEQIESEMRILIHVIKNKFEKRPQPAYSGLVLDISQEAWVNFRDKQCGFEQHLYGGVNSINAVKCKARMNKQRIIELKTYLD